MGSRDAVTYRSPRIDTILEQIKAGEIEAAQFHDVMKLLDISELRELGREMLKANGSSGALLESLRAEISARRF